MYLPKVFKNQYKTQQCYMVVLEHKSPTLNGAICTKFSHKGKWLSENDTPFKDNTSKVSQYRTTFKYMLNQTVAIKINSSTYVRARSNAKNYSTQLKTFVEYLHTKTKQK